MSTGTPPGAPRLGLLISLAATLSACAASRPPQGSTHFSDLHFVRTPKAGPTQAGPVATVAPVEAGGAAGPALRARVAAPPLPSAILPVSLRDAQARVQAYLDHAGFALETRPEAGGALVTATRMGLPSGLEGQAVCGLEALRRPTVASTDLTVRLSPAPGGVALQASARFVEIDTKLLSGDLARQTCRSNGVLEAAVQRAARGG